MRPAYVGICGSDVHEYTGGPVLIPDTAPHHRLDTPSWTGPYLASFGFV